MWFVEHSTELECQQSLMTTRFLRVLEAGVDNGPLDAMRAFLAGRLGQPRRAQRDHDRQRAVDANSNVIDGCKKAQKTQEDRQREQ
jgi:hypothetical protein